MISSGFQPGANSFERFLQDQGSATADLTPMLDTIFLIILLLLSTLINSSIVRGFPVNVPAVANKADIQKHDHSIEISIDKSGTIYFEKESLPLESLADALWQFDSQKPSDIVLLRADRLTSYGEVARVLCFLSSRFTDKKIILITQDTFEPSPDNSNESQK